MDSGRPSKPNRMTRFFDRIRQKTWIFPLVGFASLVWFLIRVIPKPSRAGYPCQRAAFPIASGFVLWLMGISTSFLFFHRARERMHQARYVVALFSFATAIVVLGITYVDTPTEPAMADESPFIPIDEPNQPVGQGRGINPGRVVWAHNPDATSWDAENGYWWEDENTNPIIVDDMVSQSLRALASTVSDSKAWDKLFKHFNARRGKGEVGYRSGEKIAVKLNMNQVGSYQRSNNWHYPAPQLVLALTRQLVNEGGVADSDIAFYDATRNIHSSIVDKVHGEFPNVRFVDWQGTEGREKYQRDLDVLVHWSEELTLEKVGGNPTYLPTVVTEAEYLLNVGVLKGHSLAGVTLCAKNLFGSFCTDKNGIPTQNAPQGAGVHPYATVHPFLHGGDWNFEMRDMGTYNALVDLMGHEHLGEKTLLFVVDGLYPKTVQNYDKNDKPKWQMAPFNDDWASSIFISQDFVAIESVGVDFLRSEPTQSEVYGNIDNYLHEAALANEPPSGKVYAPNGDGVPLPSLGVHEHWNNPVDKQYSGNLGKAGGIELVTPEMVTAVEEAGVGVLPRALKLRNYPNPFNASTILSFDLPDDGKARLEIVNVLGQQVALLLDDYIASGNHENVWDGRDRSGQEMSSGVYFVRLTTENELTTRKILLSR